MSGGSSRAAQFGAAELVITQAQTTTAVPFTSDEVRLLAGQAVLAVCRWPIHGEGPYVCS